MAYSVKPFLAQLLSYFRIEGLFLKSFIKQLSTIPILTAAKMLG